MGHFVQLAHLVQVTLEVRRRYVAYKVPVVHLVQFGQNCSVGVNDSKYRVTAIFPLPVWPLEPLEAFFWHLLAYLAAISPTRARKTVPEANGPLCTVRFFGAYRHDPLWRPADAIAGLWPTKCPWST